MSRCHPPAGSAPAIDRLDQLGSTCMRAAWLVTCLLLLLSGIGVPAWWLVWPVLLWLVLALSALTCAAAASWAQARHERDEAHRQW